MPHGVSIEDAIRILRETCPSQKAHIALFDYPPRSEYALIADRAGWHHLALIAAQMASANERSPAEVCEHLAKLMPSRRVLEIGLDDGITAHPTYLEQITPSTMRWQDWGCMAALVLTLLVLAGFAIIGIGAVYMWIFFS